jgi:hypothetical protein
VLEYVKDLDRAFAIPILRVAEHEGLSAKELREEPGSFHPPRRAMSGWRSIRG